MQHARIYIDIAGKVIHVATSKSPIDKDHIKSSEIVESWDMEIGDDTLPFKHARELLDNLEVPVMGGAPAFKSSASLDLKKIRASKVIKGASISAGAKGEGSAEV